MLLIFVGAASAANGHLLNGSTLAPGESFAAVAAATPEMIVRFNHALDVEGWSQIPILSTSGEKDPGRLCLALPLEA